MAELDHAPLITQAIGGALEGAERNDRETLLWDPSLGSADQIINPVKQMADARGRDMVQNDGYAAGAADIHKDNIVGAQYRLNSRPNWYALGASEDWAEEFQTIVEARFTTVAESEDCWLDASRRNTLTGMVRLILSSYVMTGEGLGTVEWIKNEPRRPCKTAVQIISPDRLSNPNGTSDTKYLRRGVERDFRGRAEWYHIRAVHPSEVFEADSLTWKRIAAEKPWGRKQVIHIYEQQLPDQSRGISAMVAVLKQMRMTKKFQDVVLQNAVVNASFAAAIESDMPTLDIFSQLGANDPQGILAGLNQYLGGYLGSLARYLDASKNIAIDGAKIPHLFPGSRLKLLPAGTPGGVGTDYEQSLLRHIAAALGLSYEQFSRDYTKTNYSSARASMNEMWKSMQAKKKAVADRFATNVFMLWLEEEVAAGNVPLPPGKTRDWFYEPLVKDALCRCDWVGASRGQIDELKETQAAALRISSGFSTLEKECARLGEDYREVIVQRAREMKLLKKAGLYVAPAGGAASERRDDPANDDNQTEGNE